MNIIISTNLPMPIEWVWSKIETPNLLEYVASPILKFEPLEPQQFPSIWGESIYQVNVFFLNIIPLGRQSIVISKDPNKKWLLDNGSGDLAKKWKHLIAIQSIDSITTRYTDKVEIEAGFLTPVVWLFAVFFYHHRQFRWQKLIKI